MGARGRRTRNWRRDLERADRRTRALVREQPLLTAAAAIAAGYVLGRLVRI
jgi:hypothetical protein